MTVRGWQGKIILIAVMGISATAIEYLAGMVSLKLLKTELWDYSREWGNIQGVVCPRFAIFWTIICALYLLFIHRFMVSALDNLTPIPILLYSLGFYFGALAIDVFGLNLSRDKRKRGSAHSKQIRTFH